MNNTVLGAVLALLALAFLALYLLRRQKRKLNKK
jgi:LPXTG-motif cell wall-anchored protein